MLTVELPIKVVTEPYGEGARDVVARGVRCISDVECDCASVSVAVAGGTPAFSYWLPAVLNQVGGLPGVAGKTRMSWKKLKSVWESLDPKIQRRLVGQIEELSALLKETESGIQELLDLLWLLKENPRVEKADGVSVEASMVSAAQEGQAS